MKRYAIAGASMRALDYAGPIVNDFRESAQLVGIFDINLARANFLSQRYGNVAVFNDFEAMIHQCHPDFVIVTTVDRYHHEYIIRALEAGCDVITEKPLTIDAEKCRAILDAEQRSAHKIIVTFNYRFTPYASRIKELLAQGVIGQILSIDFEWLLDTSHGADYFRRWHRRLENSGGLLVHKATHHFDIVNWWLDDEPEQVYAFGDRRFYGPTRSERGERCSTCIYKDSCEFYVDYAADPLLKGLYFDTEYADGYYRDSCVFAEEIDIYDTMSLTVKYKKGGLLSYSLVAYSPYEGWRIAFNGTDGRLEAQEFQSGQKAQDLNQVITVFNRRGETVNFSLPKIQDVHGGGDERLVRYLFSQEPAPDPLGRSAGSRAGAMSVLIGIAANNSIKSGQPVAIADLLR